ncbi:spermidine synthase [Thiolapillus sp.]
MSARPPPLLLLAVALLAAVSLAFEVLLMRLLSLLQWHHFAYMIISLALLGYGASGTLLVLFGDRLQRRFHQAWTALAAAFATSLILAFWLAEQAPFNPLELLWDPWQWLWLAVVYLLLMLPFLFVALLICISFERYATAIGAVYGADLLGAGVGALAVVGLLHWLFPEQLLPALAALAFAAAALGALALQQRRAAWLSTAAALVSLMLTPQGAPLEPNPFKPLQQQLQVMGARVIAERSSPLARLTVVESPKVPLRHAPGMSLNTPQSPPEQLALFSDGDAMTAITRFGGDPAELEYLGYTPEAAAWELLPAESRVLVLGAGTGMPVLRALHHGASRIDAVEVNPDVAALMREDFADYSGNLYARPEVRLIVSEARRYTSVTGERFQLIELPLLDAFNAASAGLYAVNESYVYTVEAFRTYLSRLAPRGLLSVTRWVRLPPREGVKLFAIAVTALEQEGIAEPGKHLIWLRGWRTATLLVRMTPFNAAEVDSVRRFARARSFDLAWAPGMRAAEANRYNRLPQPWFHSAARAILSAEREQFFRDYRFHVSPATDDQPYFYRFFRWSLLPELIRLRRQGSTFLQETGYLVLAVTLLQALVLAGLLLLAPLAIGQRSRGRGETPGWRQHAYFFTVGLAFMFVEIIAIQLFIRYLAHPLYAVAVVLSAFLVFAGLGAWLSLRVESNGRRRVAALATATILVLVLFYLWGLDRLFDATLGWSDPARIVLSIGLIAPLALCMGFPFTLGLSALSERVRSGIPWAWAVNGFASVFGSTLATLLAIHLGLAQVLLLAGGLYLLAWLCWPVATRGG